MREAAFALLRQWCESLVELQVREVKMPGLYGGILCPSCSRIHGRSLDAVYPLLYIARATGEEKYLDAALALARWADHVTMPDGSWVNEPTDHLWRGITVFGAISLGQALRFHDSLLDKESRAAWTERFARAAKFLYNFITMDTGNINYPVSCAYAMALAGQILAEPKYLHRAKELARKSLAYFSAENRLLFGEGKPQTAVTTRGCRPVDLGYNVEESLPNLALYGKLMRDRKVLDLVAQSLLSHLEFMLPDGAWDNSWGTRNYKWTYWGSRTADGCQVGYAILADRHPLFWEAARRNLELLAATTHQGVLYGGPHYYRHGVLPCIHHTFCHAKALATVLDYTDLPAQFPRRRLPREAAEGIKDFPEIGTYLIAKGPWRGTVTASDWVSVPDGPATGGALSLLWHHVAGPVCVASLTEYSMPEPPNMQPAREEKVLALTPRLELEDGGVCYRNISYLGAGVSVSESPALIAVHTRGKLVDCRQNSPPKGEIPYAISYRFARDFVEIEGRAFSSVEGIRYILPIVSPQSERVARCGNRIQIKKSDCVLEVEIVEGVTLACGEERIFNLVPGFEALPVSLALSQAEKRFKLRITLK